MEKATKEGKAMIVDPDKTYAECRFVRIALTSLYGDYRNYSHPSLDSKMSRE